MSVRKISIIPSLIDDDGKLYEVSKIIIHRPNHIEVHTKNKKWVIGEGCKWYHNSFKHKVY